MTLLWRSLQYVPAHIEKYVGSSHIHEADGVILDLEDGVPADQKTTARDALVAAIETVGAFGADVLIRINDGQDLVDEDISAAVRPGVSALVAPKVSSVEHVLDLDAKVSAAEARNGVAAGATRLLVLIETAGGFLRMADIGRASPRVVALNLGAEDFALDVGMEPDDETLSGPRQQVAIAAAAAGVIPLGLMGQTTRFDDLVAYRALAERSWRFGFRGSSCIHPSQIAILNEAFSPSEQEAGWAERVLRGAEDAERMGRAAFAIDGRMIDPPIVARATRIRSTINLIQNKKRRRLKT